MKIIAKIFSFKLITSFLALAYSVIQVRYFGASRIIEIYFAAQSLIYLVTSMTQSGQLAEIFLPEFHKLNSIKKGIGFDALNIVIFRMFLWGLIIIFLVFIFSPVFIDFLVPGFSSKDKELAVVIFRVLLPFLFLQISNSFFIVVLNASERFGIAEFLGVTNTLVSIFCLLIFYSSYGVWALVISLLVGKLIEFIFYSIELYKIGFRYKFLLSTPEFDHISFFKTMKSTFIYVGATQFYSVVLTSSISYLPEGSYAIFTYVKNLTNKIKGLFIQPFMIVFFTKYSILFQKSKSVVNEFNKNIKSIVNINGIIIIGSVIIGDFIIEILWGSENFNNANIKLAYLFLLFNVFGILLSSIGNVYRKMSVANGKGKFLYNYCSISQILSAVSAYFLILNFNINGLLLIIPLNSLYLGLASYFVYMQTQNNIKYSFLESQYIYLSLLIFISFLIKINFENLIITSDKTFNLFLLIICFCLLSVYPIVRTLKVWSSDDNI